MKEKKYKSVRWLIRAARPVYLRIIFLALCAMCVSWISVRFALVSKDLLDAAINPEGIHGIKDNILKLLFLVCAQLSVQIAYTMVHLHSETAFKHKLQRTVYRKLLGKKWQSLSKFHSGEILNRLNGDAGIVTSGTMAVVPNVFAFISRIILGFTALYALDRDFALIFIVVGPIVMIVARIYSRFMKPIHKKALEAQGKTHSYILETIRNILVVKSFGAYDKVTSSVKGLQKITLKHIMKKGYLSIFANILFYISLTIGYYFAVGWCAVKISRGIMTVGTFTAIIQLVGQIQTPFRELAGVVPQFFAMTASAERIMEFEQLPDEEYSNIAFDTEKVYESMEAIVAENIDFSYDLEKIFDSASVTIEKNTITAIAGISGIGKSTFMKLLLGILESDNGRVFIKTENGDYNADASARSLFAYVPQGNMILSGSVGDNIRFMTEDVTDEQVREAARVACIDSVIDELTDGYDTVLGEGGLGLSEGQIQRLAVARAICSGAHVLLLDEATSALDEATERKLLENIRSLKDRTCVIISHKEAALSVSDKVLKICDGKIIAE